MVLCEYYGLWSIKENERATELSVETAKVLLLRGSIKWWLVLGQHDSEEAGAGSHPTLNVQPVYDSGLTGRGVTVSILDDGIEHTHSDLAANYVHPLSFSSQFKLTGRLVKLGVDFEVERMTFGSIGVGSHGELRSQRQRR